MYYKHGSDFSGDIKRQIRAIRAALAWQGGPLVSVPKTFPVFGEDGKIVTKTVEECTEGFITERKVPVTEIKYVPEPAYIAPREYHRLGDVR